MSHFMRGMPKQKLEMWVWEMTKLGLFLEGVRGEQLVIPKGPSKLANYEIKFSSFSLPLACLNYNFKKFITCKKQL